MICKFCGKEFLPNNKVQMYCHDMDCRRKRSVRDYGNRMEEREGVRRKQDKYPERACKYCGKIFKPIRLNHVFCHFDCSSAAVYERKKSKYRYLPKIKKEKAPRLTKEEYKKLLIEKYNIIQE